MYKQEVDLDIDDEDMQTMQSIREWIYGRASGPFWCMFKMFVVDRYMILWKNNITSEEMCVFLISLIEDAW
jgi:hypothetical protein